MNKIDLVEKKKDLLTVAEQFKDLPGYERHFMISGLKGSGVKDQACVLFSNAFICDNILWNVKGNSITIAFLKCIVC
ncbi:hypothetical protein CerSpe_147630 [Prunus speciosa]